MYLTERTICLLCFNNPPTKDWTAKSSPSQGKGRTFFHNYCTVLVESSGNDPSTYSLQTNVQLVLNLAYRVD